MIRGPIDGKFRRVSGGWDLREAKRRVAALMADMGSGWRPGDQKAETWQRVAQRVWRRHKQTAGTRNLNRQGYVRDNIRITCVAANLGMNNWGYDTLLRLARGVVRNAGVIVPEPLSGMRSLAQIRHGIELTCVQNVSLND